MDFLDTFDHQAKFSGVITHDNYSDIRLDLNGDLEEFQVPTYQLIFRLTFMEKPMQLVSFHL